MPNRKFYNYGSRGAVAGESTAIEQVMIDRDHYEIGIVFHFTPNKMYIWTVNDAILDEFEDAGSLGETFNNLLHGVDHDRVEVVKP